MSTLIIAPQVTVRIWSTVANSIIDVSDDIESGTVVRTLGPSVSTLDLTLANGGRKYDGLFTPMDRFVVYMRRLKPMLIMSGYLDDVPVFSAVPGSVRLSGSCSLKLLQNFYWDPGSSAASTLFQSSTGAVQGANDGGLSRRTIDLLSKVAGWEEGKIHLGGIPRDWFSGLESLAAQMAEDADSAELALAVGSDAYSGSGSSSYINGESLTEGTTTTTKGIGPGTGTLPATHGRCSWFGGPGGGAYGNFALTNEPGTRPNNPWYCAMRWPYVTETLGSLPGVDVGKAKAWWANRRILVTNPRNGKSVVVRAADWGPNVKTGRAIDLSPQALKAIGASTDSLVEIAFASGDPFGGPLGPLRSTLTAGSGSADGHIYAGDGSVTTPSVSAGPTAAGTKKAKAGTSAQRTTNKGGLPDPVTSGWGSPGDKSNQRTITVQGCTFTVHYLAQDKFRGFVNDLVNVLGYNPVSIGGFNARKIAGSSRWSNHAWGAAIDIDPSRNPRYGAAGGYYALPHPPDIIRLARKWGLGWGGEWHHSKDYMHFEVIGAPSSPSYGAVSGSIGGSTKPARWLPPVSNYTITSRFGDGGGHWASGTHSGTDFAVPEGTPIHPVGPGVIHLKGYSADDYGNYVSVDHGSGVYSFYGHMEAPSPLSPGDHVTHASVLGKVGQTGNATGPHVHVELRLDADTYTAATKSGGIEKYVLGGAPPPRGVSGDDSSGDYTGSAGAAASGGGGGLDLSNIGGGLLNAYMWMTSMPTQLGLMLGGYRALMNDEPILNTISEYMSTSFRDFCSAPNGDFIGWFPDYFGHYQMAGKMIITPLEIDGSASPPSIRWSDSNMKTHQFVVGTTTGFEDDSATAVRMMSTAGIASVEFPEILSTLLNVTKSEAEAMSAMILKRYGARPETKTMRAITGAKQEFYFACMEFMKSWSEQYRTSITTTFMPEVYPGMLACFPLYGIQGYVREVTHSFSMTGGFSTSIAAAPWSTIGDQPNAPGLPKGAPL